MPALEKSLKAIVNMDLCPLFAKLLCLLLQSHLGIKGVVTDENGSPISNAVIHVQNETDSSPRDINHDVTSGIKKRTAC